MKKEALQPRLERLAQARPDQAEAVREILDGWESRAERDTFARVQPLMEQFKLDYPGEAEDVERVMGAWRRRLDHFEPTAIPG